MLEINGFQLNKWLVNHNIHMNGFWKVVSEKRIFKQENTHTGTDSSSVNNIPLLSDYQHCNIICYCKEHNGQKYVLKKLT